MIHIINEGPGFTVVDGDWVADKLCWDEMLGLVASLTIPENFGKRRYMNNVKNFAEGACRLLDAEFCEKLNTSKQ